MKRACACLVAVVAALLVAPAQSSADARGGVRVRMHKPVLVDAHHVRLKGRVFGRSAVQIQRYVKARNAWVKLKRVRADRNGRFRTTVRIAGNRQRYRAAAGQVRSAARVVPAVDAPKPDLPTPPEPAPSDACGPQPLKDDGSRWSCTLAEDFEGTQLDRGVWRAQTPLPTGSDSGRACYVDDHSVISVGGGALHLSVREVPEPVDCPGMNDAPVTNHIAGGVMTYRLFSQRYGRFEARIKSTDADVPGLHEAFWLWPDDRYNTQLWPYAGEIDISETYSSHPDLSIPFLHYSADLWGQLPTVNTAWTCTAHRGQWNTYTLEWTPTMLRILVNGRHCLTNTSGDQAFQKPYIIALTQMLGATGNEYDGRAPLPAEMLVDYVRVWK